MCSNAQVPASLYGDLNREFVTIRFLDGDRILRVEASVCRAEKVEVKMEPCLAVLSDFDHGGNGETLTSIPLDRVVEIHVEEYNQGGYGDCKTVSRWLRSPDGRLLRADL